MAKFDLPATVDKILSVTGAKQLFYVGHSQGGGIGLAQLSQDPVFASKIKLYVGLAPAAYIGDVKSPVRLLMPFALDLMVTKLFVNYGTIQIYRSVLIIILSSEKGSFATGANANDIVSSHSKLP